ncbi:hypothetical protein SJAV_11690 [Sulfurisphaera javensis]|uniref:Uncharacterized protein n=1 Tax=Sulfurisphaera javensis TaxID=2049879 RepID=A0AAT9GQV0_9CREN
MKSFLGSTIAQGGGIFAYTTSYEEARKIYEKTCKIFTEFSVKILDLKDTKQRLDAINLDPDIADFKEGYVIAIGV